MKTRILTAIGILAVVIPVVIFSHTIVYPIFLALLSGIATFEMLRVIGTLRRPVLSVPALLFAAASPLGAYFIDYENGDPKDYYFLMLAVLFVLMMVGFAVAVFAKGELPFAGVAETFVTLLYIVGAFTSLSIIRYLPNGIFYFIFVFVAAWITDVFAYFTGFFFGKHKLIPEISPKKTVEGALGGIVFAVVLTEVYALIVDGVVPDAHPKYLLLAAAALILSVVSQIGDLVASLIKREHGVKDYGKLLPGHGGIMDRFDSILPVAVFVAFLAITVPLF